MRLIHAEVERLPTEMPSSLARPLGACYRTYRLARSSAATSATTDRMAAMRGTHAAPAVFVRCCAVCVIRTLRKMFGTIRSCLSRTKYAEPPRPSLAKDGLRAPAGSDRRAARPARGLPSPVGSGRASGAGIWLEEAHHSTAIEGNTLVLKQVEQLSPEGRAVGQQGAQRSTSRYAGTPTPPTGSTVGR